MRTWPLETMSPAKSLWRCLSAFAGMRQRLRTDTEMRCNSGTDLRTAGFCKAMAVLSWLVPAISQATPVPTAPVQVEYHQATDVFNVLDNLSDWLPGYTSPAYGEYWEAHIGLDTADRAAISTYAAFRRRTAPVAHSAPVDAKAAPDLFAPASTRDVDGLAQAFVDADDFQTGVTAAIAVQAPQDRIMLRDYYARFGPRAMRLVAAQSHFDAQRAALVAQLALPGVLALAKDIRGFYGVDAVPPFVARFLWWPDPDSTQAKVRGRIIMLQGPADGADRDTHMDWAPIVLHEYTHYVSAGQSRTQRQRLSATFLQGCPTAAALPNPLNAFEEPLAIYWGQARFEQEVRGRALPTDSEWYFKPMPDRIAKAIAAAFPAAGPAPSLDDPRLMKVAMTACRQQR